MSPTPWYLTHISVQTSSESKSSCNTDRFLLFLLLRLSCIIFALPSPLLKSVSPSKHSLDNACDRNLPRRANFHWRHARSKLVAYEHDHQLDHIQNPDACYSVPCINSWCPYFLWASTAGWQYPCMEIINFIVAEDGQRLWCRCIRGRGRCPLLLQGPVSQVLQRR